MLNHLINKTYLFRIYYYNLNYDIYLQKTTLILVQQNKIHILLNFYLYKKVLLMVIDEKINHLELFDNMVLHKYKDF